MKGVGRGSDADSVCSLMQWTGHRIPSLEVGRGQQASVEGPVPL